VRRANTPSVRRDLTCNIDTLQIKDSRRTLDAVHGRVTLTTIAPQLYS
jgi:hypothetical protein